MQKLNADDLLTLEKYSRERVAFRDRVLAHKRVRRLQIGPEMTWCFEDRLTVHYQIQEMLRVEKIFELAGIEDELAAYNPLIPDGQNLKVTLLIEIPDPLVRRERLALLRGVEDRCYMRVAGHEPVFAVADEDLERENAEKTSSVHFLRFDFSQEAIASLRSGSALAAGVDHPASRYQIEALPEEIRLALIADFA
ncbi:MAG: DUF3501 family protein [Pseudomonadota bacterium]